MKTLIILVSATFFLSGCGPDTEYEFFNKGYCNILGQENFSNKVYIKNTSSSKIITYTILQTISETNSTSTIIKEIAPGDFKLVGCDHDAQGHKKYEVVGAYYGPKTVD